MRFRSARLLAIAATAAGARLDRHAPLRPGRRAGRCRSPTSTASATSAISTSRPTAPGSPTPWPPPTSARDKDEADVWLSNWAGTEHIRLTTSPDARIAAALQPRRQVDRLPVSSRTRGDDDKTTGGQIWLLSRQGGEARRLTEPQGRRRRLPVVARLDAAGVRRRRPRSRGGQGRRRQDAEEADRHRPLRLQARQRRLPGRTAASHLYLADRRHRRHRDADDRRLGRRAAGVVARWQPHRVHQRPRQRRRPDQRHATSSSIDAKAGAEPQGADHLERPRRPGPAGVEPGRRRRSPTCRAASRSCSPTAATRWRSCRPPAARRSC